MVHRRGWIWKRWFGRRRGSLPKDWQQTFMWIGGRKYVLDVRRGSGYVLVAVVEPGKLDHVVWSLADFTRERRRRMRKKAAAAPAPGGRHLAPMETEVFAQLMPLVEHMAVTRYDDGDLRKVGRITFSTHGSIWQADIKDPDTLQQMRVSAPCFDELLALVARLLSSEEAPWEPDTWAQSQQKKSKK